ncbi:MAG: Spy/CpxP family protein refolding chaperone [Candidatus Omnitrophica bacterium]|nr:Spy/CpxP family protein refolding chaperone [Candidatus Omnitrophota bacterium]
MKNTLKVFLFAVSCLALLSLQVLADEGHMDRCNMMMKNMKMRANMEMDDLFFMKTHYILANGAEINLTEDQETKIKELVYSAKKAVIMQDAAIESLELDIMQAFMKSPIDVNAINGLIDNKYAAKASKAKDLVAAYVNLQKILTKDQQNKLKDMWMASMTGDMTCGMTDKDHEKAESHEMMMPKPYKKQ